MKTVLKKGLYILLGGMFYFTLAAQDVPVRSRSPEEVADNQTEAMNKELSLNPNQKQKVKEINLKYVKQMDIAEAEKRGLTESIKAKMTELEQILTPDQNRKWMEHRGYWLDLVRKSIIMSEPKSGFDFD